MVAPLDRKLLRDLAHLRGQVITISLVVACGIASFILMQSTYRSLELSRDSYYERFRFGDVFASLKRAPESLALQIGELPQVSSVDTRIIEPVTIPIESMTETANGTLVSLPESGQPALNAIYLRAGRFPERSDEILLLETFANAHNLRPFDRLPVVINGTLRQLLVVGLAMSPEFVFAMSLNDITVDEKRFAVLWMKRSAMAPAFQMDGAFNSVTLRLDTRQNTPPVLERLDTLLGPYGGVGAVARERQLSNFALNGELAQLSTMATVIPAIFLGVAAFLLNVVLARLVNLQRPELATLKAIGYADRKIAFPYLKLVAVIVLIGALLGICVGAWLAEQMVRYYGRFFKFPELEYQLPIPIVVTAILVSLIAATAGALGATRHIAALPPAEAMRPPAPITYRPMLLERLGFFRFLSPIGRMIVREVQRKPIRTLISALGISMATAIVVVGQFWNDATEFLIQVQFHRAMREDLSVSFLDPRPQSSVQELKNIPGVIYAEGQRMVPVRMRRGARFRDSVLWGLPDHSELRRVLDQYAHPAKLPQSGILLTKTLANILHVSIGETVEVELREGRRRTLQVPVTELVDESFGMQGYMRIDELYDLLREEHNTSLALLRIDHSYYESIHRRLKKMSKVASVTRRDNVAERFQEQSGDMMRITTFILTLFAVIIAVGVVYNNARVALSVRGRDLASLRVLGFTKAEVATILIGELSIELLLGIPLGLLVGTCLSRGMMSIVDPETYRFPVIISVRTYIIAATSTVASGAISALLVRHRLNQLDLISVLKTRE